jgi:hypothetical protein
MHEGADKELKQPGAAGRETSSWAWTQQEMA